jgi:hypothetical protein
MLLSQPELQRINPNVTELAINIFRLFYDTKTTKDDAIHALVSALLTAVMNRDECSHEEACKFLATYFNNELDYVRSQGSH